MSFKGCREAFPPSAFLNLKKDGATATVVFLGEPEPREGTYRGKARVQALFPVIDRDGLHVWPVGVTLCNQIEDQWDNLSGKPVRITRHGVEGSQDTKYSLEPVKGFKSLLEASKAVKRKDNLDLWERVASAETGGSTPEPPPRDPDEPPPSDDEAPAGRSRRKKGGQPQEIPL